MPEFGLSQTGFKITLGNHTLDNSTDAQYEKWSFNSETADYCAILDRKESATGAIKYYFPDGTSSTTSSYPPPIGTWYGANAFIQYYSDIASPKIMEGYAKIGGWNFPNAWYSSGSSGGGNSWSSTNRMNVILRGSRCEHWYNSEYPTSSTTVGAVVLNLPADNAPLPVKGVRKPGDVIMELQKVGGWKVSKPGYSVPTATSDQLIIGGSETPLVVYLTARTTIGPGITNVLSLANHIPSDVTVLMQYNATNSGVKLPMMHIGGTSSTGVNKEVGWRINNRQLEIINYRNVQFDVRYMLVANRRPKLVTQADYANYGIHYEPGAFGLGKGFNGNLYFMNPGGEIVADSRWAYLPLIQEGTVDLQYGMTYDTAYSDKKVISYPNQGYIPFVFVAYNVRTKDYSDFNSFNTARNQYYNGTISSWTKQIFGPYIAQDANNRPPEYAFQVGIGNDYIEFKTYEKAILITSTNYSGTFIAPEYVRYYIFAIPDLA